MVRGRRPPLAARQGDNIPHTARIRVAPIQTLERRNDPHGTRPGRRLYQPGALFFLPTRTTVSLFIDHDDDREIGYVREIVRMEESTGPWLVGRAVVTDPTAWLRRGTAASLGSKILHRSSCYDDLVHSAIVAEISVLSPGVKPAEPLAQVTLLERVGPASSPAARPSSPDRAAGEVIYGGQLIRRPGIVRVLGVRWPKPAQAQETIRRHHPRRLG